MPVTGDMTIGALLEQYPELEHVLFEYGMHCPGCPAAHDETITEACETHGIDLCELMRALGAVDTRTI